MRAKPAFLVGLLLCVIAPLASDAGAGQAKCCNLAASFTADLFPGGSGDEDFFTVPGGPPSMMLLIDNSGSMQDFPQKLKWPTTLGNGQGTCAVPDYADAVAARLTAGQHTFETSFNFTNGNSNSPSWVTGNCSAANSCLFKPTAFYGYRPDPQSPGIIPTFKDWTETAATERTASAACTCTGDVGSCLNGTATDTTTDLGKCVACLNGSGYYLFKDKNGTQRAAFSGAFLNVFPPKYIMARKVLKDVLSIDPSNPSSSDNVRFGITTFTSSGPLKPILPNCTDALATDAPQRFITARQSLINAVDGLTFNTITPLAQTLFKVAQYFSDGATSSGVGSQWATWFPGWWDSTFWNGTQSSQSICWPCQQSSVLIVTDGAPKDDNSLPNSSCNADHTKLLDPANSAACNGDFTRWKGGTVGASQKLPIDCPGCGTDENGSGKANLLHLVAAFMRFNDLRKDPAASPPAPADADTTHMSGAQNVSTYTISFGLDQASAGAALLQKTADLGGGTYVDSTSADELSSAIFNAVSDVITKATTFSVSNTNTLQASTAAQLFTARFRPLDRLSWEGHLYRFTLFNELALGCDPTKSSAAQTLIPSTAQSCVGKNPNLDGKEVNGLAACSGFYIVDKDCDPVVEDPVANVFKKGTFVAGVLTAGTTDAVPFWDAGRTLSDPSKTGYRSADEDAGNKRTIYTVLDNDSTSGDGKFDSHDSLVEFTVANVDQISPYLSLDSAWCTLLYSKLGFTAPATWTAADFRNCAKQVIWYVRGFDVLDEDEDGCGGPGGLGSTSTPSAPVQTPIACTQDADCSPSTTNACNAGKCVCASGSKGEERNLANGHWKLGDIFHSSPQSVDPPYNEVLCDLARGQTQCVATIHSPAALTRETQTAIDVDSNNHDAYDQWRAASTAGTVNRERRRIVLAGGNDGMLHAFDAGGPDKSQAANAFGDYPYDFGTGEELWAFIPPDLLPKLKFMLAQPNNYAHQYFVDGNVMVRDIWVDGGADGTGTKDRRKQANEFHTLAILSERAGGTQFVALDITNPLRPSFRWTFPQLCSLEQNLVGQSWSDFAPRPPPIGPVKLAFPTGVKDGLDRTFEERWITLLNGGYDPSGAKGRGVWMVDAWTGDILWQFTDADFQAVYDNNTPASMFPVAASPGLEDIGDASQATLDSDGYFDTATWGDMGGQLWVARFKDPGVLQNGRVNNWFAARAMEELRSSASDDTQKFWKLLPDGVTKQFRSEFYRMTANIWEADTSTLRSFLGSGNRDRLLTVGATCGPSNILGCAQSDCNVVDLTTTTNVGGCTIASRFQDNSNSMQHNFTTFSNCSTTPLDCGSGVSARVQLHLNGCNGTNPSDIIANMTCDGNGLCSDRTKVSKSKNLSTKSWPAMTSHNRFYGVWAYDSRRSFNSKATAKTFDQNRFSDVAVSGGSCNGPAGNACTLINTTQASVDKNGAVTCDSGPVCAATKTDPGWFYEYGRKCPLASCPSAPEWALPWTDEKTGSGATVVGHCVDWNTIRPMGMAVSGTPCQFGSGTPQNFTYLADAITGTPSGSFCGFQASSTDPIYRATSRTSIAPPLDPTMVVTISKSGKVRQTTLQIEPGTLNSKDLAQRNEMSQTIYWLEVPRDLHTCRHVDKGVCE